MAEQIQHDVAKTSSEGGGEVTRREALGEMGKLAVGGALAAVAAGGLASVANAQAAKGQWGVLVDLNRCTGCQACSIACKAENEVPLGVFRRRVRVLTSGKYPKTQKSFAPLSCMHCADPSCLKACKEKAIYKTADGLVLIDQDKCKNKRVCQTRCPYRNVFTNPVNKKAEKCTMCVHRVSKGLVPACVQTCVGGALTFGNIADPRSDVAKAIKKTGAKQLLASKGTKPSLYYAGLAPDAEKALEKLLKKKGALKARELEDNII